MNLRNRFRRSMRSARLRPSTSTIQYSEPLENIHPRQPTAFTTLPARVHKKDAQVVEAVKFFNEEMTSALLQTPPDLPCRLNSSVGHMSSVLFPECLPERLAEVAMLLEAGAIHDDITEKDELAHATEYHKMITLVVGASQGAGTQRLSSIRGLKGKTFISRTFTTFITKYGPEGRAVIQRCLENWLQPMELVVDTEPTSFEDSVSSRVVNAGARVMWGLLEFSQGILLSDEDMNQIKHIVDVADRVFVNTNDYFSWEVERDSGQRIQNTIKVIMAKEGKSDQQAKEKLRLAILDDEQQFQVLSKQFALASPNAPSHVRRFLAMLELFLGGHHLWCAACERYKVAKALSVREEKDAIKISHNTVEDANSSITIDSLVIPNSTTTLSDSALLDPVHYIQLLPSKNMRSKVIDALNIWCQIPHDQVDTIKGIVGDLHNSSLILDDIQDSSPLRRGFAATHHVFGTAQSINSATYLVAQAACRASALQKQYPHLIIIFLEGLKALSLGQSWDLNWKFTGHCPTEQEYMTMVDGKTGVMFEMIIQMMHCFSSSNANWPVSELTQLTKLLGRWYQVRDDYQNLQDTQYTAQKGLCEDLDEGKLSYPLTVCCNADPKARAIIMGILRQRQEGTPLELNVKMQILDLIRRSGALQRTWALLQSLEKTVDAALSNLETLTGVPNPSFRAVVSLLGNIPPP